MIVMPLVELDRYLIRKGYGIFNIDEFIDAMLAADSVDDGYAALKDSHHDLNHDNFAGVEADAVKLAARQGIGGLTPQDIQIINDGEARNPQAWHRAFQKAVNAGAPLINEAIEKTNEINRQKAATDGVMRPEIPLAFQKDMGNFVAVQAWRQPVLGRKNGQTHNDQGALVTQYVSALTGEPEAYARPYYTGLQALRKEKYPALNLEASDEISPRILHGNTLYLKDHKLRNRFALTIQNMKMQYPNLPPQQLKGMAYMALKQMPEFNRFAGISHSDGLQYGIHSEEAMSNRVAEQQNNNASSKANARLFIHPEIQGKTYFKNMSNAADHYFHAGPSKEAIEDFKRLHGWDEETTRRIYREAAEMEGRGVKRKFNNAVMQHEMADGTPPSWATDAGAILPSGVAITSPIDEKPAEEKPPSMFDFPTPSGQSSGMQGTVAPKTPIQQATEQPPQYPIRPDPPEPPKNPSVIGASPTPVASPPPPPPMAQPRRIPSAAPAAPPAQPPIQQNLPQPPMQPLNAYPSTAPAVQNTGRGFLDNLMTRLGYAYESLFPSFGKADMSDEEVLTEMLENVQLEIAKKEVVQTIFTKAPHSISSVADVSMIASKMNRPNSDIVSIFHSRGDWGNVAKMFGMTHQEVQTVKVVFNEQ